MKDKNITHFKKKLADLEFNLGLNTYRNASMNPGPGIEEENKKLRQDIKRIKSIIRRIES